MPKLHHFDRLGTARFVTFGCFRRRHLLADAAACEIVLTELARLRDHRNVRVLGYVIMPDHVHLILHPPDDIRLGTAIGVFKTRTAHRILELWNDGRRQSRIPRRDNGEAAVWQRRCYDHNCRTDEIVIEKLKYCHDNPVKRGLVDRAEDWPWSSCRWYLGHREGVFPIDELIDGL